MSSSYGPGPPGSGRQPPPFEDALRGFSVRLRSLEQTVSNLEAHWIMPSDMVHMVKQLKHLLASAVQSQANQASASASLPALPSTSSDPRLTTRRPSTSATSTSQTTPALSAAKRPAPAGFLRRPAAGNHSPTDSTTFPPFSPSESANAAAAGAVTTTHHQQQSSPYASQDFVAERMQSLRDEFKTWMNKESANRQSVQERFASNLDGSKTVFNSLSNSVDTYKAQAKKAEDEVNALRSRVEQLEQQQAAAASTQPTTAPEDLSSTTSLPRQDPQHLQAQQKQVDEWTQKFDTHLFSVKAAQSAQTTRLGHLEKRLDDAAAEHSQQRQDQAENDSKLHNRLLAELDTRVKAQVNSQLFTFKKEVNSEVEPSLNRLVTFEDRLVKVEGQVEQPHIDMDRIQADLVPGLMHDLDARLAASNQELDDKLSDRISDLQGEYLNVNPAINALESNLDTQTQRLDAVVEQCKELVELQNLKDEAEIVSQRVKNLEEGQCFSYVRAGDLETVWTNIRDLQPHLTARPTKSDVKKMFEGMKTELTESKAERQATEELQKQMEHLRQDVDKVRIPDFAELTSKVDSCVQAKDLLEVKNQLQRSLDVAIETNEQRTDAKEEALSKRLDALRDTIQREQRATGDTASKLHQQLDKLADLTKPLKSIKLDQLDSRVELNAQSITTLSNSLTRVEAAHKKIPHQAQAPLGSTTAEPFTATATTEPSAPQNARSSGVASTSVDQTDSGALRGAHRESRRPSAVVNLVSDDDDDDDNDDKVPASQKDQRLPPKPSSRRQSLAEPTVSSARATASPAPGDLIGTAVPPSSKKRKRNSDEPPSAKPPPSQRIKKKIIPGASFAVEQGPAPSVSDSISSDAPTRRLSAQNQPAMDPSIREGETSSAGRTHTSRVTRSGTATPNSANKNSHPTRTAHEPPQVLRDSGASPTLEEARSRIARRQKRYNNLAIELNERSTMSDEERQTKQAALLRHQAKLKTLRQQAEALSEIENQGE